MPFRQGAWVNLRMVHRFPELDQDRSKRDHKYSMITSYSVPSTCKLQSVGPDET